MSVSDGQRRGGRWLVLYICRRGHADRHAARRPASDVATLYGRTGCGAPARGGRVHARGEAVDDFGRWIRPDCHRMRHGGRRTGPRSGGQIVYWQRPDDTTSVAVHPAVARSYRDRSRVRPDAPRPVRRHGRFMPRHHAGPERQAPVDAGQAVGGSDGGVSHLVRFDPASETASAPR